MRRYTENETELFAASMMNWAEMTGFRGKRVSDDIVRFDRNAFSIGSSMHTYFVPPNMTAIVEQQLNQLQNRVRKMNGDREIAANPYFIQGTFNRTMALSNDYLHFFAPGDPVFDSVVQNALYSYKGRSSAFAVVALIFTWQLRPNESILLENGVDVRLLGQYMGYLPGKQLINTVAYDHGEVEDTDEVIRFFQTFDNMRVFDITKKIEHFGKRKPNSPLLGIKEKYGCSDIEWFRKHYPQDRWVNFVKESYAQAKKDALEQLRKQGKMKALQADLIGSISSYEAAQAYFEQEGSVEEIRHVHELLLEAFQKSKVELDSVCFVRMVKPR